MEHQWSPEVGPNRSHLTFKGRGQRRTPVAEGNGIVVLTRLLRFGTRSDSNSDSELDEAMGAAGENARRSAKRGGRHVAGFVR